MDLDALSVGTPSSLYLELPRLNIVAGNYSIQAYWVGLNFSSKTKIL